MHFADDRCTGFNAPWPNPYIILAYQCAVAPDLVEAADRVGRDRRDIGVLAVTSADRLNAEAAANLYHHYGIDADGIVAAVNEVRAGQPVRFIS